MKKFLIVVSTVVFMLIVSLVIILTNPKVKRSETYLKAYALITDVDQVFMKKNSFSSYFYSATSVEEMVEILKALDICNIDFTKKETVNVEDFMELQSRNDIVEVTIINDVESENEDSYIVFSDGTVAKIDYEKETIEYSESNVADYEKLSKYVH